MNEVVDDIYEDETAEELYERIQREKERLIKEGKLKKQKKLPEISEDEIPFEIPKNWKWVRLGEVAECLDKLRKPINAKERSKRVGNIPYYGATGKVGHIDDYLTNEQLVLLGEDGAPFFDLIKNKAYIIEGKAWINNHAHILRSIYGEIGNKYLCNYLNVFNYTNYVNGTTRLKLTQVRMNMIPISVPPLSEQKRISELIDRLFEKLDEAKEKALSALNTSELRKGKILHLAIQGKLSKQLDEYGTAEELYERIQREKEGLIGEGKLKKQKKLPEIFEDEIPFEIPKNWKWVRLGEVFNIIMGQSPDGESINIENNGVEFHQGKIYFDKDYILESEYFTSKPTKIVEANTVLLCVRAPVGTLNITNRTICIGRGLCGIDTFKNIDPKFILYFLRGFEQDFIRKATGTTFIAITLEVIKNQVFPLPPLEEQKEIVKLLDSIFEKEKKAKKLIESTLDKIELVKKSILARAVRGEL